MRFLFGEHVLDTARRELRRGGEPIAVEPQVFDLLVYLLQNRARVVSKDDLLASVWGGRIVSDATLDSRIAAAAQLASRGVEHMLAKQKPQIRPSGWQLGRERNPGFSRNNPAFLQGKSSRPASM